MNARPILFSAPMVNALLDGRKTQTRRTMKPQPSVKEIQGTFGGRMLTFPKRKGGGDWLFPNAIDEIIAECRYGKLGDYLWVRESWGINHYGYIGPGRIPKSRPTDVNDEHLIYFATEDDPEIVHDMPARPSIHMPRWCSRLTLEISEVRIERLQEIREQDALAEGLTIPHGMQYGSDPVDAFRKLWSSINGAESWNANPWVWVLGFTTHLQNVDTLSQEAAR